jgi:hypothetical protein
LQAQYTQARKTAYHHTLKKQKKKHEENLYYEEESVYIMLHLPDSGCGTEQH